MKKLNLLLLAIIIISILLSCKTIVKKEQVNVCFDENLQGRYIYPPANALIIINNNSIQLAWLDTGKVWDVITSVNIDENNNISYESIKGIVILVFLKNCLYFYQNYDLKAIFEKENTSNNEIKGL